MPDLSLEVQSIVAFIARTGVPVHVTATLGHYVSSSNPCSPHSPGSYHCAPGTNGSGLAVDLGEPAASHDTPGLLRIFAQFASVESSLAELFYSGAPYAIKDGRRIKLSSLGAAVVAEHHNHVHVAVRKGTMLVPIQAPPNGGTVPAHIISAAKIVGISVTPSGKGYYIIAEDGAVFAFGDAVFIERVYWPS